MFWETFLSLCRQKNEAPNVVTKKLGLSSGSATFWKNGKVPHHSTLLKIADYFGVSVDYLLGKEKSPSAKAEEPVGLSMGFSRQKYWSGLPFPPPGDRPDPGIESTSLHH